MDNSETQQRSAKETARRQAKHIKQHKKQNKKTTGRGTPLNMKLFISNARLISITRSQSIYSLHTLCNI